MSRKDRSKRQIKGLYQLGVEIEENSELDLFESFNAHDGDLRIASVVTDMEKELGDGNKKPEILAKLAQYELTLLDWIESHKGSKKYVAIAGKCWPAFQTQFGFVPCYAHPSHCDGSHSPQIRPESVCRSCQRPRS